MKQYWHFLTNSLSDYIQDHSDIWKGYIVSIGTHIIGVISLNTTFEVDSWQNASVVLGLTAIIFSIILSMALTYKAYMGAKHIKAQMDLEVLKQKKLLIEIEKIEPKVDAED